MFEHIPLAFYQYSGLVNAIVALFFGLFGFVRNPKRPLNRVFGLMNFAVFVWAISYFFWLKTSDVIYAKLWVQALTLGSIFIFPLYAEWVTLLIGRKKSDKYVINTTLALSCIFLIFNYAGILFNKFNDVLVFPFWPHGTSFYVIYIIIGYVGIASYAFIRLIRLFPQTQGQKRTQIRYLLVGSTIAALGGITNFPLWFGIKFPPIGNPLVSLYTIIFGYAMIRHRLMDIRVIVSRSFLYGALVSVIGLFFTSVVFLSSQFVSKSSSITYLFTFIVAAVVVFGIDPLKKTFSILTDKVFYQAKVDYVKLLQKLSSIVSIELDLQKLIDDLEKGLNLGLKVKSSFILLRDQQDGKTTKFRASAENDSKKKDITINNDSQLIRFVREHQHLSLLEALERKIEDTPEGSARNKEEESRAEFERLGVALVAPIFSENHLVAVLTLGPKLSGDSFSNEDTQLIDVLAPQIGSAIQKANLYEEVREFSAGLKVKVQEATKELQTRNVSLQTLQTITKDITRTLDFGKVVQNIANAVSTELGFLGAILVFLDDDGKTLRARAVTETPLTQKAIKLLPKKFTDYTTDITTFKSENLGSQVISTGEIRYSENMVEVLSPPIPKPIVMMMQKIMGIRTMILVPIVSEERVIGVIEVGARRKREQISQSEIETLQSMADELGVVARNISLFDRVRKANDQLEVANKHLQELDRAKSEFVSIASHQLRTPMTGIMGYLSMMTQGDFGKVKPEHQKILVDLLAESQRMIRLINQFLNVSKIEAGKFTYTWKPMQLEEVVKRVMNEVEMPAAEKKLKLTVKMPKTKLPIIQADADKIEDVVLNLIDNAIKYTATGTIVVSLALENDMLHLRVKDSGIGIKPQDATELFSKFVRGSGIAQIHPDGSGLGLFIAKSIIDAHGGKIWAESDGEGQGSTFQFTLPLHQPISVVAPLSAGAVVTKAKG